jgi:hypothetical protein
MSGSPARWFLLPLALAFPLLVALAGCDSTADVGAPRASRDSSRAAAAAENERPVIGHFETRTHLITVHSSAEGPRFTLTTREGEVVGRDLPAGEFQAHHPALFDVFRSSVAGGTGQAQGQLDARVLPVRRVEGERPAAPVRIEDPPALEAPALTPSPR